MARKDGEPQPNRTPRRRTAAPKPSIGGFVVLPDGTQLPVQLADGKTTPGPLGTYQGASVSAPLQSQWNFGTPADQYGGVGGSGGNGGGAGRYYPEMEQVSPAKPLLKSMGATGTAIPSGIITSEEYNPDFFWRDAIALYEQMSRSEGQASAITYLLELPIRRATVSIEPFSDESVDKEIASFIETCLFHDLKRTTATGRVVHQAWDDVLRHILMMLRFGFSAFEVCWRVEDGWVKWAHFLPLLPRTVWRWWVGEDSELEGIQQWTWKGYTYRYVDIPADKLLLFVHRQEGQNYEGVSLFRAAYQHWYFKEQFYRIQAVGIERNAISVPVINLPEGFTSDDITTAQKILGNLRANEQMGVTLPPGWGLEYTRNWEHTDTAVQPAIDHHDVMMARSVLAQFVNLGSTETGAYALDASQKATLMSALQAECEYVEDIFNNDAIPRLVDYNYADVAGYPKLKFSKVLAQDFDAIAGALQKLMNMPTPAIHPDLEMEDFLRNEMGLPKAPRSVVEGYNPTAPDNGSQPTADGGGQNAGGGGATGHAGDDENGTAENTGGGKGNRSDLPEEDDGGDGADGGGGGLREIAEEARLLREALFEARRMDAVERGMTYADRQVSALALPFDAGAMTLNNPYPRAEHGHFGTGGEHGEHGEHVARLTREIAEHTAARQHAIDVIGSNDATSSERGSAHESLRAHGSALKAAQSELDALQGGHGGGHVASGASGDRGEEQAAPVESYSGPHFIAERDITAFAKGNAAGVPSIGYHYADAAGEQSLHSRGVDVSQSQDAAYGIGFNMFGGRPEGGGLYGGHEVRVAVHLEHPLHATGESLHDLNYQFRQSHPELSTEAAKGTTSRWGYPISPAARGFTAHLRSQGYDGVIVQSSRGPVHPPVVVAFSPRSVRVIDDGAAARESAGGGQHFAEADGGVMLGGGFTGDSFDPSQARGYHGRWIEEGGGKKNQSKGGGKAKAAGPKGKAAGKAAKAPEPEAGFRKAVTEAYKAHGDKSGRAALHDVRATVTKSLGISHDEFTAKMNTFAKDSSEGKTGTGPRAKLSAEPIREGHSLPGVMKDAGGKQVDYLEMERGTAAKSSRVLGKNAGQDYATARLLNRPYSMEELKTHADARLTTAKSTANKATREYNAALKARDDLRATNQSEINRLADERSAAYNKNSSSYHDAKEALLEERARAAGAAGKKPEAWAKMQAAEQPYHAAKAAYEQAQATARSSQQAYDALVKQHYQNYQKYGFNAYNRMLKDHPEIRAAQKQHYADDRATSKAGSAWYRAQSRYETPRQQLAGKITDKDVDAHPIRAGRLAALKAADDALGKANGETHLQAATLARDKAQNELKDAQHASAHPTGKYGVHEAPTQHAIYKSVESWPEAALRAAQTTDQASQVSYGRGSLDVHKGDLALKELQHAQGFDGKPEIVNEAALEFGVKKGDTEIWRGDSKETHTDNFMAGEHHAGLGIRGSGTYTAEGAHGKAEAQNYTKGKGLIMRMALKKDARVISYERLQTLAKTYVAKANKDEAAAKAAGDTAAMHRAQTLRWLAEGKSESGANRLATVLGYDAVRAKSAGHIIVLNRTALRVSNKLRPAS